MQAPFIHRRTHHGFEYNTATTMMLVLLIVVTAIDAISSQLRRRLDSL